ncbi:MAG TPA: Do family serine endopeptidase [Pyrinomonadaceae bacterium]|nr:Do family serine endopeptidase [Pyrinomonadaceae bacterium]
MRYRFFGFLLIALLLSMAGCKSNFLDSTADSPAQIQPQSPPVPIVVDGVRTSYADVVDKTSLAVVQIEAEVKSKQATQQNPLLDDPQLKEFFRNLPQQPQPQRPRIQRGVGSGVIVSADGTILTNYHVVGDAQKITVLMNDNRSFSAKIVGSDQPSDLAVLKVESENLPFLNLGNSDNVRIGDIVLAIGNPLGIGQTVTAGIISAKGRRTGLSDGSFEDFLQTDAPINQGNSGGALVNLSGELIGINSQILSGGGSGGNIGIGFSIPSNMAKSVMEQLVQTGRVRRGMLGVNIQNITADTAKALELKDTKGVLVSNVRSGSSAEKAGIKRGDIITAINGERVEDSNTLRNKVAGTLPGNSIKISVLRGDAQQEFTARLDEFNAETDKPESSTEDKKDSGNSSENGKLGLSLQSATPEILKQLGLPDDTKGLVVTEVDQNGAAAEVGIVRGDVIVEINRNSVETTEQVQSALEKSGDRPVLLLINRKGQTIYLTVAPGR